MPSLHKVLRKHALNKTDLQTVYYSFIRQLKETQLKAQR
jgi:hypothetical protein